MAALPVNLQRWTLKRLDDAFQGFFRRVKARNGKAGLPRFRGKGWWESFGLKHWIVARTSPGQEIHVASALAEFEAWTATRRIARAIGGRLVERELAECSYVLVHCAEEEFPIVRKISGVLHLLGEERSDENNWCLPLVVSNERVAEWRRWVEIDRYLDGAEELVDYGFAPGDLVMFTYGNWIAKLGCCQTILDEVAGILVEGGLLGRDHTLYLPIKCVVRVSRRDFGTVSHNPAGTAKRKSAAPRKRGKRSGLAVKARSVS